MQMWGIVKMPILNVAEERTPIIDEASVSVASPFRAL